MEDRLDIHPLLRLRYLRTNETPPTPLNLHGRSTNHPMPTTRMPASLPDPSPEWHVFHHPLLRSASSLTRFPTPPHPTQDVPGLSRSSADSQPSPASPIAPNLVKPHYRPQSLINLEKALERLNAPLPERPNTLPPYVGNPPHVEPDLGTALNNPFRWPLPRHVSDSEAKSLPLRDLVVFVDVRNDDGDFVGYWFVGVLQDLGAKVRDLW